jgi:hypothetical protein
VYNLTTKKSISMGKMKEIFIENENKPKLDPVSNCCGANMLIPVCVNGPDFLDLEMCPSCLEHCSIEK